MKKRPKPRREKRRERQRKRSNMSKKYFAKRHSRYYNEDNSVKEEGGNKLSFLTFFLKRKFMACFSLICVIVLILGIINIRTVIVKAKSVVVALEIYKKYNVKISPRYVEDISKYEIKDVDVCDLRLAVEVLKCLTIREVDHAAG